MPALVYFHEKGWLKAVVTSPGSFEKNLVKNFCNSKGIKCLLLDHDASFSDQVNNLLVTTATDLVFVFGFSKKIPDVLLQNHKLRFLNIHFSLLPAYRGPAPLFWQIKNGETATGITIHKMDSSFDGGPILYQEQFQLYPEESFGALNSRLSQLAVNVIRKALEKLNKNESQFVDQDESLSFSYPSVKREDLLIDWENQTAAEIMNLVNACNPIFSGAITFLNGQELAVVEVSPAIINDVSNLEPGTIAYADGNYGLFVACKYNTFLRINIVQTSESILSGYKLIALGLKAGVRFQQNMQQESLC
nr:formyltransferase family protein [Pedobacter petrophilus]